MGSWSGRLAGGVLVAVFLAVASPARAGDLPLVTSREEATSVPADAPCRPGENGWITCKPAFMLSLRDAYLDSAAEAQTCKVRLTDALADQQPVYAYQGAPPWVTVAGVVLGAVLGGAVVFAVSQ